MAEVKPANFVAREQADVSVLPTLVPTFVGQETMPRTHRLGGVGDQHKALKGLRSMVMVCGCVYVVLLSSSVDKRRRGHLREKDAYRHYIYPTAHRLASASAIALESRGW